MSFWDWVWPLRWIKPKARYIDRFSAVASTDYNQHFLFPVEEHGKMPLNKAAKFFGSAVALLNDTIYKSCERYDWFLTSSTSERGLLEARDCFSEKMVADLFSDIKKAKGKLAEAGAHLDLAIEKSKSPVTDYLNSCKSNIQAMQQHADRLYDFYLRHFSVSTLYSGEGGRELYKTHFPHTVGTSNAGPIMDNLLELAREIKERLNGFAFDIFRANAILSGGLCPKSFLISKKYTLQP